MTAAPSALAWLLEPADPGVRYLALRDLVPGTSAGELAAARRAAHTDGPIATILDAMEGPGFWAAAGPGYNPKYRSTVWSVVLLAQLGAHVDEDVRIERACAYLLEHAMAPGGQFSGNGAPSGTVDCLHGNLCWALLELGTATDRLGLALDWLARSVTGDGIAPRTVRDAPVRYYSGKCGPGFACGSNDGLPCAWGAIKVMRALARWPESERTPAARAAIARGLEFLLATDPATAAYPTGYSAKPSRNWWKFGFPVFYISDILETVEVVAALGHGRDPRLANAIDAVVNKRAPDGTWMLEYDYAGKTWIDVGPKGQPNKWVTLRALSALAAAER
ncbi:MAG: nitrogen fixation protein NifH [Dehalococcoidia bacterium]|nr:nitrogen fixation protein NifH [Dehalococcoidia bacterium]